MKSILTALALLSLAGCGSMSNSAGGNMSGAGRTTEAGCGAVQVGVAGGAGNGGVCLWQPCAIGKQTIDAKGDIENLITGWACNPTVAASPVTGTPLPSTPANAGDAAAAAK